MRDLRDDDLTIEDMRMVWDDMDHDYDGGPDVPMTVDQILDLCDSEPPSRLEDPNPRMFSDLDDDKLSRTLFRMWRAGILEAEFEEGATHWWLSEFGVEIGQRGMIQEYADAIENEDDRDLQDQLPPTVRILPTALPGGNYR